MNNQALLRAAAWPAAVIVVFQRVFILALNGTLTDDFTTVHSAIRRFIDGQEVYEQAYTHVDPLYLYSPGATLILSPLGLGSFEAVRAIFIVCNAAAIIAALALLTRLVGHSLRGALFPSAIALAFLSESVTNTLAFTNINGLLFLALVGFLWGVIRGDETNTSLSAPARRRWRWVAGVCIGLAILIKPQFAPLLFLPLVRKDWRSILVGLAIPVLSNLVAWPLVADSSAYLSKLVPYLGTTRDFANSSWEGVRAYFDVGPWLYYPLWLAFAALVAAAIVMLLRWRDRDNTLWVMSTAGIILLGVFFLSSLGQQYYSMWLFPLLFTAFLPRSIFHTWGAWLAAFLFLAPLDWSSNVAPDLGRWANFFAGTVGWGLLIVVSAATVCGWWQRDKRQG
ncbi:glycosyltransferase family 87 protein [Corynebacterium flavescens]|uniref:glycosyltransferase family 87 protein n=1 Tax=Corynebacterium flavescens TaxID=28028 RepID=UPI003FD12B66